MNTLALATDGYLHKSTEDTGGTILIATQGYIFYNIGGDIAISAADFTESIETSIEVDDELIRRKLLLLDDDETLMAIIEAFVSMQ